MGMRAVRAVRAGMATSMRYVPGGSSDPHRYFRVDRVSSNTGSPVCNRVDELLDREVAVRSGPDGLLAGARDERHLRDLRGLLARATLITTQSTDFEDAAAIYRSCRRGGETVRKLIDCLIAAHAIRSGFRSSTPTAILTPFRGTPIDRRVTLVGNEVGRASASSSSRSSGGRNRRLSRRRRGSGRCRDSYRGCRSGRSARRSRSAWWSRTACRCAK